MMVFTFKVSEGGYMAFSAFKHGISEIELEEFECTGIT